jgi:hypothetical protein
VQIVGADVLGEDGKPRRAFEFGETVTVQFVIESSIEVSNISVSYVVSDMTGTDLFGTTTFDEHYPLPSMSAGERIAVYFKFPAHLRVGNYGISGSVNRVSDRNYLDNFLFDALRNTTQFSVAMKPERPVHYKVFVPTKVQLSPKERQ